MPNDADSAGVSRPASGPPPGRPVLATLIVVGVVLVDQLTKAWAVRELADGPVWLVGSDIGFRLARNTGSAFSLFRGFTPLLAVLAIMVAFFLVRSVRRTDDTLLVVSLSLILGGALGNLVDRLFRAPGFLRGGVVDFIGVSSFPTFNVADSAVTIGAVLLAIWAIRADIRERREEREEPANG